jgi:hypothetical protein
MLKFTTSATSLLISGKTFHIKDILKSPSLQGQWDPRNNQWILPIEVDTKELRKNLRAAAKGAKEKLKEEQIAQKLFDASPEGVAAKKAKDREIVKNCLEMKKTTGAYHWICCEECEVVDWGRQHTYCDACADNNGFFKNGFSVRGRRYTGD